jgi:hypothetical protein
MKRNLRLVPGLMWLAVHEGGDGGAAGGDGGAAGGDPPAGSGGDDAKKTFTQEQVNAMLAEDRRKHKTQVEKTVAELEALKKNNKGLSEKEKSELTKRIEDLNATLLTKEELAAKEKEKLQNEHKKVLTDVSAERDAWKNRYVDSTIEGALTGAAAATEAFNPSQIVSLLRGTTRLVEVTDEAGNPTGKFEAKISLADVDKEGKPVTLELTALEALKRMKDREDFANLFKSNVTGGLGGSGNQGAGKDVDPSKMSPEQWMAHRKKMGLGRKSK